MKPPPPPPPTPYDYQVQWIGFSGVQRLELPEMRLADVSAISFRVSTELTSEMVVVGKYDEARLEFFLNSHTVGFWDSLDSVTKTVNSKCPPEITTTRYDIMQDRLRINVTSESVSNSREFAAISNEQLQASHVLYVGAYRSDSYLAFEGNLYSLQIYRSGILAINLIPVVLENEGCFYDTVNEIFYKNKGTRDLIIGPRV